jgi:multidrug efflux pump subunit AcrA (membrane-fusion protein)
MNNKFIAALFITLITLTVTSCNPNKKANDKTEKQDDPAFAIKTTTVTRQNIQDLLDLSGDVKATSSVDVYPETTGKLTILNVQAGTWVKKNQILGYVDPSKPGMDYAKSPIKAPIDGTITSVNADEGSTIGPQIPLFTIGDISKLKITAQVSERFIYRIKKDQKAIITTSAFPNEQFYAQVNFLSPIVNPISRTMEIEFNFLENTPIKAGMFVQINLITDTKKNVLVIPEKALVINESDYFVYKIINNVAYKVAITVGIKNNGFVQIEEGLTTGDVIAIEGTTVLSDKTKVKIVSTTTETAK